MALLSLAEQEMSSLCFCPHPWAVGAEDVGHPLCPPRSQHTQVPAWSSRRVAGLARDTLGSCCPHAVDVATAVCPKQPPRGSQEMEVMLRDVCDTQGSVGTANPHHWVLWGLSPPC